VRPLTAMPVNMDRSQPSCYQHLTEHPSWDLTTMLFARCRAHHAPWPLCAPGASSSLFFTTGDEVWLPLLVGTHRSSLLCSPPLLMHPSQVSRIHFGIFFGPNRNGQILETSVEFRTQIDDFQDLNHKICFKPNWNGRTSPKPFFWSLEPLIFCYA
jgi:hypothetical protein